ncbi:MAG: DUF4041 domain-containing protein [Veillonella dispar]|jgi:hypothetical protein|uniref:DUF4041 domain-containing protein n=1 Tax=Veillonella dispar TaxID=39778 RepID=UPI00280BD496|nr:DUF4041 domain-containing protein [Veillonella dispar]MDU2569131.1 DUF4041 domain-containing protein [Veillonella sp.]MDU4886416.1 DUF4041 domain-containing protein [Veillonella dispar]
MDNKGEKRFLIGDVAVFLMAGISVFWPVMLIGVALILLIRYHYWALIENEVYKQYILNKNLIQDIEANQSNLATLKETIEKEKAKIEHDIEVRISKKNTELNQLCSKVSKVQDELKNKKQEVENLEPLVTVVNIDTEGLELATSQELKNILSRYKLEEAELVKNNTAIDVLINDDKKFVTTQIRQILRSFNAECDLAISNVTLKNIDTMRNKILRSYETLNKIYKSDGVQITKEFLENKLQQLITAHSYQEKLEDERVQKKLIQEQLKEEEKVRREIEREKAKIEKDETQFKNEISKLMKYLQKTDNEVEKTLYIDKIKECEEKLSELETVKSDVLNREKNTRAGFVYIISNIGSFGENIFKIGMTRRLEPMDRIKELSSASVPFEFDVHALIFSDDAPALESILHSTFREYEVNKVNHRKEFFSIPLEKIEKVVTEHHNATVQWTYDAAAEEYRESLAQ